MHGSKRCRMVVPGVLAVAATVFLLPASPASAVTFDNACVNSTIPSQSMLMPVTMTASASPNPVSAGGTVTLSNIQQHVEIAPWIFIAGYNAGVLTTGTNNFPITGIRSVIAGTNTVEGTQTTNNQTGTATTTITDPDGTPGTGDETSTPGAVDVTYNDQTWTASPNGGTIDFREETRISPGAPNPPGFTTMDAGINFTLVVAGGAIQVRFGCDPGEVVQEALPSTIVRTDPAPSFASTQTNQANITINDVSQAEGNSGTTAFNFTVSMDAAQSDSVTVDYSTANGTATAPGDYTPTSGTLTFAPGETSKTVTEQVNGDTAVEPDETFFVNLSNATGNATIADNQGVGTIVNDDVNLAPIANAGPDQTVASGAAVSLDGTGSSDPNGDALTYSWSQVSGPTVTLTGANTATPSFTAPNVSADTNLEFQLQVCDPAPLCATDNVVVTVRKVPVSNITINDVSHNEGNSGTTAYDFTVSLGGAQPDPVTVDFATAANTATTPSDYTAKSGTVTFAPGSTSQTVTVQVNGDTAAEPDETFFVNLSNATGNATIADNQGVGTIINDDGFPPLIDITGVLIVNGSVSPVKTSKSFVFKVSNLGVGLITINPTTDISAGVDVNGTPTGSVSPNSGTKTLSPGASTRVKLVWSYAAGDLTRGDAVAFNACVKVLGDLNPSNDCDSAIATAK